MKEEAQDTPRKQPRKKAAWVRGSSRDLLSFLNKRLLPFRVWLPDLRSGETLKADIVAGVTVALVLVPQSMAYAQLAGLPPHYGLYASFLPVIVAALFGSSRQLSTGPVAVVSLLTASALEPIAASNPQGYLAYAFMLALLVGLFQIFLGLFKLGALVGFLSHPVVVGFTNAAALIIATSQLSKLLGVTAEKGEQHYQTVVNVIVAASHSIHWPTILASGVAIGTMLVLKEVSKVREGKKNLPPILGAAILTTGGSWLLGFHENFQGAIVGVIPQGLPAMVVPTIDFQHLLQLSEAAIAISLIGFMEAYSIAKAMAVSKTRQDLDANQELIGQGLGNVAASFFQGYAVSGSFSRSAVNLNAGARTGFSSVITGLLVGATLLFLTPLLYHMPQAMLAAAIIMAVVGLIRVRPLVIAWKVQRHDAIIGVVTFLLTLGYAPHLEVGILIGVSLSLGMFVWRTMRPDVIPISRNESGSFQDARRNLLPVCCSVAILRFDGDLYFANTEYFSQQVLRVASERPNCRYVIIDASAINEIDATGEHMLHQLARRLVEKSHVQFIVARAKPKTMEIFRKTGFASEEWTSYFPGTREEALRFALTQMGGMPEGKPAGCTRSGKCPLFLMAGTEPTRTT